MLFKRSAPLTFPLPHSHFRLPKTFSPSLFPPSASKPLRAGINPAATLGGGVFMSFQFRRRPYACFFLLTFPTSHLLNFYLFNFRLPHSEFPIRHTFPTSQPPSFPVSRPFLTFSPSYLPAFQPPGLLASQHPGNPISSINSFLLLSASSTHPLCPKFPPVCPHRLPAGCDNFFRP